MRPGRKKMIQAYFNLAYNAVYDFTTARLNGYQKLQERCIAKLKLNDGDKVLCAGLGTGNEVFHLLQRNRNVDIVGVDYSRNALQKAYRKALKWGKEIQVLTMDVCRLEFAARSFDKVVCLHVMDFLEQDREATNELLRILKDGGQFVITYPSGEENAKLGFNLFKDNFRHNIDSGKPHIVAILEALAQILAGIVYLPIVLRPNKKFYSRHELDTMIAGLKAGHFQIEEDPLYRDLIVYGTK